MAGARREGQPRIGSSAALGKPEVVARADTLAAGLERLAAEGLD